LFEIITFEAEALESRSKAQGLEPSFQ